MNYKLRFPYHIDASIDLPRSKSITNRALVLDALSGGKGEVLNRAVCDDSDAMHDALASNEKLINIGAAGTTMRFLTAYFAMQPQRHIILDGTERMRQRPINILVDALQQCGADISYIANEGFPPLQIKGKKLNSPGKIELKGNISSQFISALMMIAPLMDNDLQIHLSGKIMSIPYIDMTAALMRKYGAQVQRTSNVINIHHAPYTHCTLDVEGDWSAASYWYEIAALMPSCNIRLNALQRDSVQGDKRIAEIFTQLGVNTCWEDFSLHKDTINNDVLILDMSDCPDLAQTVVVTSCLIGKHFEITGLETLRIKETDRLSALKKELAKLGYYITVKGDSRIEWHGELTPSFSNAEIDTYNDHRMALAFAPACIKHCEITIRNAEVVSKSYPDFWNHLSACGVIKTAL